MKPGAGKDQAQSQLPWSWVKCGHQWWDPGERVQKGVGARASPECGVVPGTQGLGDATAQGPGCSSQRSQAGWHRLPRRLYGDLAGVRAGQGSASGRRRGMRRTALGCTGRRSAASGRKWCQPCPSPAARRRGELAAALHEVQGGRTDGARL